MTLAIIVVCIVLAFAAFIATRPGTFRTERSISVKAPPEKIYPLINDFHRWTSWSPWEKLDENLKRSYSGASAGVGTVYDWEGKKAGTGRMEIVEAAPSSRIAIKLDFIKPFSAHNTAEFTMRPEGGSTTITWAMYGPRPAAIKIMGLFMNMDEIVGKDFERGLANLKGLAEG